MSAQSLGLYRTAYGAGWSATNLAGPRFFAALTHVQARVDSFPTNSAAVAS